MTDWLKNPASLFDIRGKVAIVTGASGAFGALAAQVLAGAGAKLFISTGNAKELAKVADECTALGGDVETLAIRTTNEANCGKIIDAAVKRFGRVDILVVASGKNDVAKITDMTPERFADVMDANVTQSWLMARAAAKQMMAQGNGGQTHGKIVLMSSARGLLGHPAGYTAYCSSKSAIDGMTKALGCELGPTGITVNAIAPIAKTRMTEDLPMFQGVDSLTAEHIAPAVLFLASDLCGDRTGHVVAIAGARLYAFKVVETPGRFKETDNGVWKPQEIADSWDAIIKA